MKQSFTTGRQETDVCDHKREYGLVSVIVPVYNAERFVGEALKSIIIQDYTNKEIIIVDDCSTDHSYSVIQGFMQKVPYITYYRLDKNSGVAAARNAAIEMAKGRFLAFLDSDDIWEQGKLSAQLQLFERHKGIPFSYTALSYIDENGTLIKGKRKLKERVSYSYILRNTVIATSTVIVDREVVKSVIMPNRKSAEDYSLWLSLLKQYGDAYGINHAYTRYRKSADSISANRMGEVKYFYSVQREDMHIAKSQAIWNTCCYMFHAAKKHFL